MPSSKSHRVSEKKRIRNSPLRSRAKNLVRDARQLIDSKDLDTAENIVKEAVASLDKASQKGVLHKRNAARRKSRIVKQLHEARNK